MVVTGVAFFFLFLVLVLFLVLIIILLILTVEVSCFNDYFLMSYKSNIQWFEESKTK